MKTSYLIAAGVILLLLARPKAAPPVEVAMSQSSDWQGDLWTRLQAGDLYDPAARNVASSGHPSAAPAYADLTAMWG